MSKGLHYAYEQEQRGDTSQVERSSPQEWDKKDCVSRQEQKDTQRSKLKTLAQQTYTSSLASRAALNSVCRCDICCLCIVNRSSATFSLKIPRQKTNKQTDTNPRYLTLLDTAFTSKVTKATVTLCHFSSDVFEVFVFPEAKKLHC